MSDSLADRKGLDEGSVTKKEIAFKGAIWNIISKTFRFHDQELTRQYVEHPGAVAVIALNDKDEVLLINQYRAPVNEFLYEIPAGLLDVSGEDKLDAAKRELLEETDYFAKKWELLQVFYTTPGSSSEAITIYLASDLEKSDEEFDRTGEEKHMETSWVSFDEVLQGVLDSRLKCPTLVVGILALAQRRKHGEN
jgi:ADP-ribose pyrophosphatase